jgi:hypothetical protein
MNRDGFWSGKRVLVLGCTGFLGTWLVRELLSRGADITGLIRNSQRPSEFFEHKFHLSIATARGPATPEQFRKLLSIQEFAAVFQLATVWESPRAKAGITTDLLHAVADHCPATTVVVPISPSDSLPRFENGIPPKMRVSFVKLPEVFGTGQSRPMSWMSRAFSAASQNRTIPAPTEPNVGIVSASTVARCLVETANELATLETPPEQGHWSTVSPMLTARELYEQLSNPMEIADPSIRETIAWYREAPVLLGTEAPQSRAA